MDGKNSVCGDRTLVDKKLTPTSLFIFSIICYFIGIMSIVSLLIDDHDRKLSTIFFIGLLLSICYTANPVGLKYKALGDVTIFLCFGPLLMQCTSIILNNKATNELYYYSIPIGLLTECILHANNARDIKADIACGATTLASLVGIEMSYILFIAFIIGSYISIIFISAYYHYGCMLTFLTIPLAIDLIKKFNDKKMTNLPEEAAKMHLPFGLLLVIGILVSPTGFY
jgi:1,4-dihydroxy-2-naphthoate octaprenyltransferase